MAALLAALATSPLYASNETKQTKTGATIQQEKVVYHINDASIARVAMRNIANHLDASPGVKIVVVTHGKGIDFLLNDAKDDKGPYAPQVADLKARGVTFDVCRNTLKGRNLDDSAVIMEAQLVPSGVAEIGKLQAREGYVYLKP
jgi:intracellular sulfur oxidation DsrE/DsrF family protein